MSKDDSVYLFHILECIRRIENTSSLDVRVSYR